MKLTMKQARMFSGPASNITLANEAGKVVCTLPPDEQELAMRIMARENWLSQRNEGVEEYNSGRFADAKTS